MSVIPRTIYGSCKRKVKHETREQAMEAAFRMRFVKGEKRIRPYHCDNCGQWHIGHPPKKTLRHPKNC